MVAVIPRLYPRAPTVAWFMGNSMINKQQTLDFVRQCGDNNRGEFESDRDGNPTGHPHKFWAI
ncbi:hypothetical protein B9T07_07500 [Limnospira fusiformis CCALA 023]